MKSTTKYLSLHLVTAACSELDRRGQRIVAGNEAARIFLPVKGRGILSGSRGEIVLLPGQLFLIPGLYDFSYACSEPMTLYWCHLRLELTATNNLFAFWQPGIMSIASENAETQFQSLLKELPDNSMTALCRRYEFLYHVTGRFFAAYPPPLSAPHNYRRHLLQPVLDRIAAKPEQRWEIEEVSAMLEMSKVSCNHLFRELTGMPPGRWITLRRVEKAEKMLLNTSEKLEKIAERCGFCDAFHFSRTFKQFTGMAPLAFRKAGRVSPLP